MKNILLNLKIRSAQMSDSNDIAQISKNSLGYDCDKALVEQKLLNLDKKREIVYVAEILDNSKNLIVGFIHIEKYETLFLKPLINILGLAVENRFQKMGIGKKLINAAIVWGVKLGIFGIRLNSGIDRVNAHKFYQKLGFVIDKQQIRFFKNLSKQAGERVTQRKV